MNVTFRGLGNVGRLGNQLHQIAATIGIASRNTAMRACLPTNWKYRPYFSIPDTYFSDDIGFPAENFNTGADERHRIYLQDVRLWDNVRDEIREIFKPSRTAREIIAKTQFWYTDLPYKTALHVRRTDAVGIPKLFPLPDLETYYRPALALVKDPVVVFSDDIDWCAEQFPIAFPDRTFEFFGGIPHPKEGEPGYENHEALDWIDLFMMTQANAHIIANSSYSWWGAWLSENETLIYPSAWWGPDILAFADPRLLFLDPRWRVIDVQQG